MAQKIVGLDIGNYLIKAVVIESTSRRWELVAYHDMPWDAVRTEIALAEAEQRQASESEEKPETPEPPAEGAEVPAKPEGEAAEAATEGKTPEAAAPSIRRTPLSHDRVRLRAGLHAFIQRFGTDWDQIHTVLDGRHVSVRFITSPFANPREISQTLPFALADLVPYELDDTVYDYEILGVTPPTEKGAAPQSHLVAVVADKKLVRDVLDDWRFAGKEPKGVGLDCLALAHAVLQVGDPRDLSGAVGLVDLGHASSKLCLFRNGRLEFMRVLSIGGADLTDALAHEFDLKPDVAERGKHLEGFLPVSSVAVENPDQQAVAAALDRAMAPLVTQIRLSLHSYGSANKLIVTKLFVTGGASRLTNLPAYLAEKLAIDVQPFHYLRRDFNRIPDGEAVEPLMTQPLGIALSALGEGKHKRLNLRRGDYAFKGDYEFWRGRLLKMGVNVAVVFAFIGLFIGVQLHLLRAQDKELSAAIAKDCQEILGRDVSDPKMCLSQMMEATGGSAAASSSSKLKPEVDVITVYDELTSRLQTEESGGVDIEDLDIADRKIKLKGTAASLQTVGVVTENLKSYPCFSGVTQGPTRTAVNSERIEFSLNITLECNKKKGGEGAKNEREAKAPEGDKPKPDAKPDKEGGPAAPPPLPAGDAPKEN